MLNTFLSSILYAAAEVGNVEITLELAKLFQLRVRYKKLLISRDRANQVVRMSASVFNNFNENEEDERLLGEENEVTEAMRVFKQSLNGVLQVCIRNEHTKLARLLLESKIAAEVDSDAMNSFFKTAVGKLDGETITWLFKTKKVDLLTICEHFINCVRRNHLESIKLLLKLGIIPTPTITLSSAEATRRGLFEAQALLLNYKL